MVLRAVMLFFAFIVCAIAVNNVSSKIGELEFINRHPLFNAIKMLRKSFFARKIVHLSRILFARYTSVVLSTTYRNLNNSQIMCLNYSQYLKRDCLFFDYFTIIDEILPKKKKTIDL